MTSTKSETVLYIPPDPPDSKPAFIHVNEKCGSIVQRNTSSLLFTWDAFGYESDILQYECRINTEQQTPVTEWNNMSHRTYGFNRSS